MTVTCLDSIAGALRRKILICAREAFPMDRPRSPAADCPATVIFWGGSFFPLPIGCVLSRNHTLDLRTLKVISVFMS